MARPRKKRRIFFSPIVKLFIPQGVGRRVLGVIELSLEEVEAVRLKNVLNLEQTQAAKRMLTSQSTFQRILISAYGKIARGLIYGRAIRIK